MGIREEIKNRIIVIDGAIGTYLIKEGIKSDIPPFLLNIYQPEKIKRVHEEYIKAGADVILTNTFSANRLKLKKIGKEDKFFEINEKASLIAREAAQDKYVGGCIGPLSEFIEPIGKISFKEAVNYFKEQANILKEYCDIFVLETFMDIHELKAAIIGVREVSDLPLAVQMSFHNDRTVTGSDVEVFCATVENLCDLLGINCTLPDLALKLIKRLSEITDKPLICEPNAGVKDEDFSPAYFGKFAEEVVKYGVRMIGTCCWSTPQHTREIKKAVENKKPVENKVEKKVKFTSRYKVVYLNEKTAIIGDRLNASRKKIKKAIEGKDIRILKEELKKEEAKCDAIDVCLDVPSPDFTFVEKTFEELQNITELPLIPDSVYKEVFEIAIQRLPGKILINSIPCKEKEMEELLPLVKKYNLAFIFLLLSEKGVPYSREEKIRVLLKGLRKMEEFDIPKENIIVDPIVLSCATNRDYVEILLDTVKIIKKEFGLACCLGIRNVSYGLPERRFFNASLTALSAFWDVDALLIDPLEDEVFKILKATEYIKGKSDFLSFEHKGAGEINRLRDFIILGDLEGSKKFLQNELYKGVSPIKIIKEEIVGAFEELKEKGYLPQIIRASEIATELQKILEPYLPQGQKKKVLMATVKGDIHDIGKNIVKTVLRGAGYDVIDLGVDVPKEKILERALSEHPDFIALSALMTSTLPELEETVKFLKENLPHVKIIIGGAPVDESIASKLEVYYGKDALSALEIIEKC